MMLLSAEASQIHIKMHIKMDGVFGAERLTRRAKASFFSHDIALRHTDCTQISELHLNFALCVMKSRADWTSCSFILDKELLSRLVWLISSILPLSLTGTICFVSVIFYASPQQYPHT